MAVAVAVGRLPGPVAQRIGRGLGDLLFALPSGRRRIALENLERAFPALSAGERRRLCRASYRHLGLMIVELCGMLARPPERVLRQITVEGLSHLKAAMAAHGRVLVLSAHLGNWELLGHASRLTGYRLATVVRPLDLPVLDTVAQRLRERAGVELIDKRRAVRPVLAALARGDLVGILLDQNATRGEAVFVPFFGVAASTSRSIAVLALRTGAAVLPVFIRRERWGRHLVCIRPALPAPVTTGPDAVVELTAHCTLAIEAAIREAPEQWLWLHDRWRTRPPAAAEPA
jgi:KDO2-lipid IV(A) lauroyltransferase